MWDLSEQSNPCCRASWYSKFTDSGGSSGEAFMTMLQDAGSPGVRGCFPLGT